MSYNSIIYVNNSSFDMSTNGNGYYNIYFFDASSNNVSISLPDSYYDGLTYRFVRLDATLLTSVTLTPSGSGITVNGSSSTNLGGLTDNLVVFRNNNWIVMKQGFTY